MNQETLTSIVNEALKKLYTIDLELVDRNLCERCLVHRLAVHLGNSQLLQGYFIDCEFNRAFDKYENTLKYLSSDKGNYVDIIVHKRGIPIGDNLICMEVKKSSNTNRAAIEKDKRNLQILTGEQYRYKLGVYINLGKTLEKSSISLYANGGQKTKDETSKLKYLRV